MTTNTTNVSGRRVLCNAFSLGMLDGEGVVSLTVQPLSLREAIEWLSGGFESTVGHADTALLLSSMTGYPVSMNRLSLSFKPGDQLLVAQYNGPRLPEGATSLPDGAKIRWYLVSQG